MKTMQKMVLWTAVTALVVWGFPATAGDFLHARVAFESGSSMIKGKDDTEWSYATLNTLVVPNDTIWVDNEGMAELEMSGGTFLRMADGSKVEVTALPPAGVLRAATGAFYIQRLARSTGDIVFEAPACKILVDQNSQVRVDIMGEGATTVSVRWGNAILKGVDGKDFALKEGERSFIDPGYLPSPPQPFDRSTEDAFDAWNRDRARLLALGNEAIPQTIVRETVPVGVADLAPHGEWITVENQPYWRPTVVADYVPYRSGYWTYVPECGYTWVERYPFSYVTTHYGRWAHFDSCGWVWSYRETWGPSWVASYRVGPNFVWSPLDPWDRPCVVGVDYFSVGSVHVGVYGASYCVAADLMLGPCYVSPCGMDLFRGGYSDIHVWNPYAPTYHHPSQVNINYGDTIIVNNYAPTRVIRGPVHAPVVADNGMSRDYFPSRSVRDGGGQAGPAPRDRVARLEPGARNVGFGTERITPNRSIRATEVRADSASTRMRQTRVEPGALNSTRDLTNRVSERAAGGSLNRESGLRSIRSTQTLGTPERGTERRSATPEMTTRREGAPTATTRREVGGRETSPSSRRAPAEQTTTRTPAPSVRGNAGGSEPAQSLRTEAPRVTERRSLRSTDSDTPRAPQVSVRQESAPRESRREPQVTTRQESTPRTVEPSETRSAPVQERRTQESRSFQSAPQTSRRESTPSRSSDAFSGLRSVRPTESATQYQPQTRRTAPSPSVSAPRSGSSPFISGTRSSESSHRQPSSSPVGNSIRSNGGSSRSMSSPQPAVQPRTMSAPSDSGRRSAGGGDSVRSNNAGSGREGRSRR